jgi:hypothetical protein
MTAPQLLLEVQSSPVLLVFEADAKRTAEAAMAWGAAGLTVRAIRGEKMHSTGALMDEFGAALQFPHYFGANWPALGECLADLDWLLPTAGIAVLVRNAEQALIAEPLEELKALVAVIGRASREYAEPIERGEWWDRPALPFRVVLQADGHVARDASRRWESAGALTMPLTI